MKKIVLISTFLGLNILSTNASDFGFSPIGIGGSKPIFDPCLFINAKEEKASASPWNIYFPDNGNSSSSTTIEPNQAKKQAIIIKIMDHLSSIIDFKGQVTTFLEENREIYGQYASLKEQKVLLESRILRLERERKEVKSEAQRNTALISSDHGNREIQRIIDAIKEQLNEDLARIDQTLNRSKEKRIQVEDDYFEVYSQWAPFQEYLLQLENLEANLMKSLKTLKEIESAPSSSNNSGTYYGRINDFSDIITTPTGYNDNGTVNIDWYKKLKDKCKWGSPL